ncbi:class II fumarate hydratase [Lentilactobacillus otakiensis]|uniref:Fumarate hydratase class II n=1 Tax=Lentilactobacillus otakiensis DSM 19908 = JCM 15040 TaxID=1423780 RepID=S4NN70_9LACO|nr:class II fumarate hydratase [Lentilactobacillus otakiensis]KRL10950.1 fumarate hydratase class II [Lentilactobacillus otakiensis DSM 19908 = JCM 15040]MBZ3777183.1 class II fumarate hydratase [Lentilactobacillus otakiensis]MDV3517780.1 class II fumarate hydratase [Lentilactobacillus otakiensis]GAD17291.1 fumarate hydratase class II [Lentilactobacillus otakiensis DSM 19908 = JCM 15040]
MTEYRMEEDTLGKVKVPKNALWGPQTERSRHNFPTGPLMPTTVIRALIHIKMNAAEVNHGQDNLDEQKADLIQQAAAQLLILDDSQLMADFPLHVYQTGSGTQTNMNVNEVIANQCKQIDPSVRITPNDDVNRSQSSNDTFPTAMNIAGICALNKLTPEIEHLVSVLKQKQAEYWNVVKIGRTHLQDATPITFGQEISGWVGALEHDLHFIQETSQALLELPIGGTAVGTGLNTLPGFDTKIVATLSNDYSTNFTTGNKFYGLANHSGLTVTHGAIRTLAADLLKIANDIRFLASGPRAAYGELHIPANEPGSSIMPGKVNPTQAEAMTMAATRVMGNDTTIEVAASQGNFEMNVYKPVIIFNFLESVELLTGVMHNFTDKMVAGITVNQDRMKQLVDNSLMTVTALSPHIGYHKAAEIVQKAHQDGTKLKVAAVKLGYVTAEDFDKWMKPIDMTNNHRN